MPQTVTQKTVNNFVNGLITEATELSFPENASVDERNCELFEDGSRKRRNGIQLEDGGALASFSSSLQWKFTTHHWPNAGENNGKNFLVVQKGYRVFFYDEKSYPLSSNEKSFSVDLRDFQVSNSFNLSENPIQTTTVKGNLVVVHPATNAFYVSYDIDSDSITTTKMNNFQIRDFDWLGTTDNYYEDAVNPTQFRRYDTYNAGWTQEALSSYINYTGKWPRLTHPWYTTRDVEGNFAASEIKEWQGIYEGNTLTSNGRFLLNVFSKDREAAVEEVADINFEFDVEVRKDRFSTVATYAGRVWFAGAGDGKVYFSQVVENMGNVQKFYQANDPTAETFSDLVDSDGGVIYLPEAHDIKLLFPYKNAILVFAENGVWAINSVDSLFKATEYSVNKVSSVGIENILTFISAEGIPFWWSKLGIYTILENQVSGEGVAQNISENSIQSYFDSIEVDAKLWAQGVYDERNRRLMWIHGTPSGSKGHKWLNSVLILDLELQAFYPWDFSANDYQITSIAFAHAYSAESAPADIITSNEDNVVSFGDQVITSFLEIVTETLPKIVFIARDNGGTRTDGFFDTTQLGFYDWGVDDFSSYVEAAYDFQGDMTTRKYGMYITTYLRVTETGWSGNEVDGYTLDNPSSCVMKVYWDLKTTPSKASGQQLYRFRHPPVVDTDDLTTINYPYSAVVTRTRIRGSGRVMRVRFESETGKDWYLLGYEKVGIKNQGL